MASTRESTMASPPYTPYTPYTPHPLPTRDPVGSFHFIFDRRIICESFKQRRQKFYIPTHMIIGRYPIIWMGQASKETHLDNKSVALRDNHLTLVGILKMNVISGVKYLKCFLMGLIFRFNFYISLTIIF